MHLLNSTTATCIRRGNVYQVSRGWSGHALCLVSPVFALNSILGSFPVWRALYLHARGCGGVHVAVSGVGSGLTGPCVPAGHPRGLWRCVCQGTSPANISLDGLVSRVSGPGSGDPTGPKSGERGGKTRVYWRGQGLHASYWREAREKRACGRVRGRARAHPHAWGTWVEKAQGSRLGRPRLTLQLKGSRGVYACVHEPAYLLVAAGPVGTELRQLHLYQIQLSHDLCTSSPRWRCVCYYSHGRLSLFFNLLTHKGSTWHTNNLNNSLTSWPQSTQNYSYFLLI